MPSSTTTPSMVTAIELIRDYLVKHFLGMSLAKQTMAVYQTCGGVVEIFCDRKTRVADRI